MKSKSVGIVIVLVIVILAIILIALLMNRNGNDTRVNPGEYIPPVEDYSKFDDGYVPEIPENFIQINQEKVVNESDLFAEAVAYYYDSGEELTRVNVYLQNRGDAPINKDAVCVIELFEEGSDYPYRFGGVIENDADISVGGRSVIRTQFVDKTREIVAARISLELPEGAEEASEPEVEESEFVEENQETEEYVEPVVAE